MFEILQFLLFFVMIREQLSDQLGLLLRQRLVIRISAQNVLEQTFDLIDVTIFLSTKFKLVDFAGFVTSTSFVSFLFFIELFTKTINNAIVMMSMFFLESFKIFTLKFFDSEHSLSNFKSLLLKLFNEFRCDKFILNGKITLIFVETSVW